MTFTQLTSGAIGEGTIGVSTSRIRASYIFDGNLNGSLDEGEGAYEGLDGDYYYLDLNNNGIEDAGYDRTFVEIARHADEIDGLAAGTYVLRPRYRFGAISSTAAGERIVLTIGTSELVQLDIGLTNPAEVWGSYYHDKNRNGRRDAGDDIVVYPPVKITAYADLDEDGVLDDGEPSCEDPEWVTLSRLRPPRTLIRFIVQDGWQVTGLQYGYLPLNLKPGYTVGDRLVGLTKVEA